MVESLNLQNCSNTYNEICSILGNDKNLFVELTYDSWKQKLIKI